MAAPTFVSAGTVSSSTGDATPGLPTGWAEYDVFLLVVETANETVSAPSGWTEVDVSPQGTGTAGGSSSTAIHVFWKRATASESAPTVLDPGNHCIAQVLAIRDCVRTGDPWNASGGNVEASSVDPGTITGITSTVDDSMIVFCAGFHLHIPSFSSLTFTNVNVSSITNRTAGTYNVGNGGGLGVATGTKASSGAIGSTTVSWTGASGGIPGFHGFVVLALTPESVSIGSGSASFNFTAAAGGAADKTGSGSASFSLTAAAGGTADKTGSGSASFSFAAEGIPKIEGSGTLAQTLDNLTYTITGTLPIVGELFQTLTGLSTTITAGLEKFGSVAKTLEGLTLEGTGYTVTLTGALAATLDDLETFVSGTATGLHGDYRVGTLTGALADVAITSSGERQGSGSYDFPFNDMYAEIVGLISLTREGAVTATLENISPEGTGGVGFGAVLAAGLRPGNLQNLEWYITGQTETHGSVTGTLDGLTTGITGTGTDAAVYVVNAPGGGGHPVNPGVLGNRYDGLIWEAPVSHWQSLCSNNLQPRLGNPIAGCVICITPIAVP